MAYCENQLVVTSNSLHLKYVVALHLLLKKKQTNKQINIHSNAAAWTYIWSLCTTYASGPCIGVELNIRTVRQTAERSACAARVYLLQMKFVRVQMESNYN